MIWCWLYQELIAKFPVCCPSMMHIKSSLSNIVSFSTFLGLLPSHGRASCLSSPCLSGQWCVQSSSSTEHACVQPTNSDCSFNSSCDSILFEINTMETTANSSGAIVENMPYHDHTLGVCAGKYSLVSFACKYSINKATNSSEDTNYFQSLLTKLRKLHPLCNYQVA